VRVYRVLSRTPRLQIAATLRPRVASNDGQKRLYSERTRELSRSSDRNMNGGRITVYEHVDRAK